MKKMIISIGLALLAVVALFIFLVFSQGKDRAVVTHDSGTLDVLVADTAIERTRGLSGTHLDTLGADGMLFVFSDYEERSFWMKGMHYPLDVIWLRDGKIMKISKNVPVGFSGEDVPRMHSRPFEVDMVLELPAGSADRLGLLEGSSLQFEGI